MKQRLSLIMTVAAVSALTLGTVATFAANTAGSELTQSITQGALSTYFGDASNAEVASPTFALSAATLSTDENMVATGTFGSDSQRIIVDNPAASQTFTLSLAATDAAIAWHNTNTPLVKAYAHNGATADQGQLKITSAGTVAAITGTTTGVTGAVTGTFTGTTPITIMQASASSDDIWKGYITDIGLEQTIPKATPVGTYAIDLMQTVASV